MIDVIEFVTGIIPFYRASEDAGIWMISMYKKSLRSYLESLAISKDMM